MKPFHGYSILLVVLASLSGLELLQARAVEQRDTSVSDSDMISVSCATKMREEKCSSISPAQNYSLMLSSPVYSPRQQIKGTVNCIQYNYNTIQLYSCGYGLQSHQPQFMLNLGRARTTIKL